jgi:hypothetical protein
MGLIGDGQIGAQVRFAERDRADIGVGGSQLV